MNQSGRGNRANPAEMFSQRYSEYLARVLNYMRLRVDDGLLAEDLTAQTFERALTRMHTLRDEDAFGGWLFSIARNVAAGYYRRRKAALPLEQVENTASSEASVEGQVVRSEELDALREALGRLSQREQEIIRLRFVAGLTNRAIAPMLGLSEGNVAVILCRALRKVRRMWEE